MTKTTYTCYLLCAIFLLSFFSLNAQVGFTANDEVIPYNAPFHPSANIGEYPSFSENTLAELAAGNPVINVPGVGVKALRPGLFESYLEGAGYNASVPVFEFYRSLGMSDHTAIIGFPSTQHRETEEYCPGIPSELFAHLYEPIWDGGANGTPVNENNYYALYLWKMVSQYKDYVRFWEIWNEPGFDYTGGLGFLPPGAPGNWWDNNPNPCDYKLRAPVFHYVRLLRISWEVIKTIDPDGYVVVSGTGYPSFLDAILRNTDNPDDGSPTADYPLKGGAYFDVMGFHAYPHFDGSLRQWSDQLNDWIYSRHSDAAADGLIKTRNIFQEVLSSYGYDGTTYPEKLWMVTEVNLPRKQFGDFIGSEEAQRNFMIKAIVTAMANDFLQLHIFKLAEDTDFDNAYSEFDLMGLYKRLNYNNLYFQEMTSEGIAHKTASDLLYGKTFDPDRTGALQLTGSLRGGAFADADANYTYVLWAATQTDMSEVASATYSFPQIAGVEKLIEYKWDEGINHAGNSVEPTDIALSATPRFFVEARFVLDAYAGCVPMQVQAQSLVPNAVNHSWAVYKNGSIVASSALADPLFFFGAKGTYEIEMIAFDGSGQVLARQVQSVFVNEPPQPGIGLEVAGPVVHFQNLSSFGNVSFLWEFGDGFSGTEPVPTHVYLSSGNYTVTLTATNSCGSVETTVSLSAHSPSLSNLHFTANDSIPANIGKFHPGTSSDFVPGWTDEQLADLTSGNIAEDVQGVGIKSLRTYIGESFFLDQGYEVKKELFQHYQNIDLTDNTFLLAFPSVQSRDPYFYCPDQQSTLFKDLYLEIWDNGENGTPVNDDNPWALYVYNTVKHYGQHIKYWEIYNSPDFDLTGDRGWLPPGEPGNWWENNPDPCEYELRAPVFYYIRSLRIAYEIIKYFDTDDFVTLAGIAYPSFLDAICRNTDNPVDGSVSDPYPLKGGAWFDAVGFKSYPHFDGSTIYFDPAIGNFAYERHSDAAVSGIARVKAQFETVLENYGYDGNVFPKKEFIISEANVPRRQLSFYMGGEEAQVNWTIKAWVEAIRNNIRQLNFFRLAESELSWEAIDPFQVMGFYQKMEGVLPYNQTVNQQGIALKTCSDLLFGTDLNQQRTQALQLPDTLDGAAFQDAAGHFIYVLWAKTQTDLSEQAHAVYSFPADLNIGQLYLFEWDYSQTGNMTTIPPDNVELSGRPIFLADSPVLVSPPVAAFTSDTAFACVGDHIQFSSISAGNPQNWEWTFEGGVPQSHFGETPPPVLYQQPGQYAVSLKVSNAAGQHQITLSNHITVEALPQAEFDFTMDGATVHFNNLSTNATTFEWCYGDGFCNVADNPSYLYFQNGDYTVTLTASSACGTSTYEQTFTIASAPAAAFQVQYTGTCDVPQAILIDVSYSNPESWFWSVPGGIPSTSDLRYPTIDFPAGGTYEITLVAGNANGFDTLTQTVYIEGPIETQVEVNLCEGSTYNGVAFFSDTTAVFHLATQSLGCDSTVTAQIHITEEVHTFQFPEFCQGDVFNGMVLQQDTLLTDTFSLPSGCDSVVFREITVYPNTVTFLTEQIAPDSSITIGNEVFNQTGSYEVTLQTIHGCDSLIHLDLTVLTATGEVPVPGVTLRAYPNPFDRHIQIEFALPTAQPVSLTLYDVAGRPLRSLLTDKKPGRGTHRFSCDGHDIGPGVYFVKIKTQKGIFLCKIAKM